MFHNSWRPSTVVRREVDSSLPVKNDESVRETKGGGVKVGLCIIP